MPFKGDILVPRRVILTISKVISSHPNPRFHTWHATRFPFLFFILAWENFERTTQVVIGTGPVFPKNIWMGPGVVRMRWCVARTPRWDVHNFGKKPLVLKTVIWTHKMELKTKCLSRGVCLSNIFFQDLCALQQPKVQGQIIHMLDSLCCTVFSSLLKQVSQDTSLKTNSSPWKNWCLGDLLLFFWGELAVGFRKGSRQPDGPHPMKTLSSDKNSASPWCWAPREDFPAQNLKA